MKWFMATLIAITALNAQAENREGELDRSIRKSISYPAFARSEKINGVVFVEFEITEHGEVEINQVNGSHKQLEDYVTGKLRKLSVKEISAVGKHFVKFNFKFVEM